MRIWSSTDRPWLLWVLCWSFGLRRFTRYSISAFPKRNRTYSSSVVYCSSGLVRSTYTLWRYPLLAKWWWRWTTPTISLSLCESSEKGWFIWQCSWSFQTHLLQLISFGLRSIEAIGPKAYNWWTMFTIVKQRNHGLKKLQLHCCWNQCTTSGCSVPLWNNSGKF